jgi:hypothetical protein
VDLAADAVEASLDLVSLSRGKPTRILPVHAMNPFPDAIQFAIDPSCFATVEAAIGNAVMDPVLQKLDPLIGIFGCALPEGARVPRARLRDGYARGHHAGGSDGDGKDFHRILLFGLDGPFDAKRLGGRLI